MDGMSDITTNWACQHCGSILSSTTVKHDCIGSQRARIQELEAALSELNMDFDTVASAGDQLAARLKTAEAQVETLREALEEARTQIKQGAALAGGYSCSALDDIDQALKNTEVK